ncbi:hypothetical protein BJV74DRAFT_828070, partial [Russula compacta]
MAAQPLELKGEHIEVVQSTAAGKRSVIGDAELDVLLDRRRKEVFEGRDVGLEVRRGRQKDGKGDGVNARAVDGSCWTGRCGRLVRGVRGTGGRRQRCACAYARGGPRCMNRLSFLCEDCILLSYFCALLSSFPCSFFSFM